MIIQVFKKSIAGVALAASTAAFGAGSLTLAIAPEAVAADATAAPLREADVERFVGTLDDVAAFGKKLEAAGKDDLLNRQEQPTADAPFAPYSTGVSELKAQYPADHAELAGILKSHGFAPAEWGAVGDRVIIAYIALKIAEENPEALDMADQMAALDPAMLAQMPPQMKAQMDRMKAMVETVRRAPDADKKAVAPSKAALDAHVARQTEE